MLVAQPCVVDPTRAPEGQHTLWAYCHVPNGSTADMSERMEAQIERFAPGFRDLVLARTVRPASEAEAHNPNLLGGDVNGGAQTLRQTAFRPVARWNPYRTPVDGVYLCSASTPPGGGVHGMCGAAAAEVALRERFGASGTQRARPECRVSGGVPDRVGQLVEQVPGRDLVGDEDWKSPSETT